LISGIPLGIWYSYKLMELGSDAFFNHLNTLSAVSRASTWLFAPSLWPENIGFLYKNAFLFLGLPSILYAFALSTRRSLSGVQSLFLPMFTSLLILWYVFISIGWWRYGYSGLILANLLAAKPIWDAFSGLTIKPTRLWTRLQQGEMIPQLIVIIVAFLVIAYPLQNTLRQIFSETDRTPQEFSQFVQNHTKPDDLIESYVWEITVLTPRNFHHPPTEVFVQALKNELDGTYDPLAFQPKYVVDGPYSKSVTLYPPEWLDACCQKIGSVGHYDLYSVSEINRP
jgi:hypothetical protein